MRQLRLLERSAFTQTSQKAKSFAEGLRLPLTTMFDAGKSLREMAVTLNDNGLSTSTGATFSATQVKRLIDRLELTAA